MKKIFYLICIALLFASCDDSKKPETKEFKVLQFNIWQEGEMVKPGGYEAIVSQILQSKADFVALSEVRNYNDTRFCDRIIKSLKDSGEVFYSFYSFDSGLLSRYPIIDSTSIFAYDKSKDNGSAYRALIDMDGQEVALYTTHLDYRCCTYYDIRGYDGSTWKEREPLLDVDSILADNVKSMRDDAMKLIIEKANEDRKAGRIIFIGGDFNEPSHLDWVESTKDMYDHHGLIIPWTVSTMLSEAGYIDTYREINPDPSTHPGITFPANNELVDIKRLSWTPKSDERERVDFIYYAPFNGLKLTEAYIWGPDSSIKASDRVKDETQDCFEIGTSIWPTDHKAVLTTFELKK